MYNSTDLIFCDGNHGGHSCSLFSTVHDDCKMTGLLIDPFDPFNGFGNGKSLAREASSLEARLVAARADLLKADDVRSSLDRLREQDEVSLH